MVGVVDGIVDLRLDVCVARAVQCLRLCRTSSRSRSRMYERLYTAG